MEEVVVALKEKHERERNLLTEENHKLTAETDKVVYSSTITAAFLFVVLTCTSAFLVVFVCGQPDCSESAAGG